MNQIIIAFRFLLKHKWKISLVFLCTSVFLFLLFPLSDLNDFITSKISQATNNKVFLQFNEMHLNPLTTTLSLDQVVLETEQIDNLTISKLSATPSLLALASKQPGGKVFAEGLLGGTLNLKVNPAGAVKSNGKTDSATETILQKSDIDLALDKISLKEIRKLFSLNLPIGGSLDLNANMIIDPAFIEQPEGDLQIKIQKFELQTGTIQLPDLGSINLPEIKFSTVDLKGKIQGGRFLIENGKLGSLSDDFSGSIKGDVGITIQNMNGQMKPVVNSYNLSIDLQAKPAFKDRASFFLNFIDQYKKEESGLTRYKFKLLSTGPGVPPQFSALN
jgi:type II secretion system protein N